MQEAVLFFLSNKIISIFNLIIGIIFIIFFVYFYLGREGRDERGRGIFATSCFYAMVAFVLFSHIFIPFVWGIITVSSGALLNALQLLLNFVFLIHIVSTLILRKIR